MNKLIIAGLGLVTVAMTAAAFANEPYLPRGEKSFSRVDANHNGKIERSEFSPIAVRQFARMDLNGDTNVTSAEIENMMQAALIKRRDRIMQRMDQDGNGSITQAEVDKLVDLMFAGADSDGDGAVSLSEAKVFKSAQLRKTVSAKNAN